MKFFYNITILSFVFSQTCWASLPDAIALEDVQASTGLEVAAGCPETLSVDSYLRCLEREYNGGHEKLSANQEFGPTQENGIPAAL